MTEEFDELHGSAFAIASRFRGNAARRQNATAADLRNDLRATQGPEHTL